MPVPKANEATTLTGDEWQLLVQNGKLSRAQIKAVIAFARTGYTTDNLPEGSLNLYYTATRQAAVQALLDQKATPAQITAAIAALGLGTAAQKAIEFFAPASHQHTIDQVMNLQSSLDAKLDVPGSPNVRSLAFATAYQATDKTKAALISAMVETNYTITLAGTQSDTVELRIGPVAATVLDGSSGFAVATYKASLTGIALSVGMGNIQRNQLSALLPPNWYFALRRIAGTNATIQGAFDQVV